MILANYGALRIRCAREFGPFANGTSRSSSTVTSLVDSAWPASSSSDAGEDLADQYLLLPDMVSTHDRVRIIDSYSPEAGAMTPDTPWSVDPGAQYYEVHGIIEPATDLLRLINQAALRCFTETEFFFTAPPNVSRINLATRADWLSDPDWVRDVGMLTTTADRDLIDPYDFNPLRGKANVIDGQVYLTFPQVVFSGTEVIYVKAIKPIAYNITNVSGTVLGLFSGTATDKVAISAEWLAAATLVEGWREFSKLLDPQSEQRLIKDRAEAAKWYDDLTKENFSLPPLNFKVLDAFGAPQFGPSYSTPSGWF